MRLQNYPFDKQQCFMRIESCKYCPHPQTRPHPLPCPHPPSSSLVMSHGITELPV